MAQAHPNIPYEDDSWREIMRVAQNRLHQLQISDVRLASDEWHALINCILSTHHMIGQREVIDLDEVAEACGNHDR